MAKKLKDINLLIAYERGTKKKDSTFRIYFLLFILEFCIFALIASIFLARTAAVSTQIRNLNSEIAEKQKEVFQAQKLVEKRTLYIQKEALLEYVSSKHTKLLEILDKLESVTPPNLRFESLNVSTEKITCTVRADKLETVTQFVYNLQTSNYFVNINFSSVTGDENSKVSTITADIVRK